LPKLSHDKLVCGQESLKKLNNFGQGFVKSFFIKMSESTVVANALKARKEYYEKYTVQNCAKELMALLTVESAITRAGKEGDCSCYIEIPRNYSRTNEVLVKCMSRMMTFSQPEDVVQANTAFKKSVLTTMNIQIGKQYGVRSTPYYFEEGFWLNWCKKSK
jgi:hypothetical protein